MKRPNQTFFVGFFSCFVLMSCLLLFAFKAPNGGILSPTMMSSAISWNEALALKNKYLSSNPLKIEISGQGGTSQQPLEGFTINAAQLLEIIQANKVGGKADEVVFYLGADDPAPGFTLPRYNLIAVGKNAGGLMIPNNDRDKSDPSKSSVFDKAEPCPPFCPE